MGPVLSAVLELGGAVVVAVAAWLLAGWTGLLLLAGLAIAGAGFYLDGGEQA